MGPGGAVITGMYCTSNPRISRPEHLLAEQTLETSRKPCGRTLTRAQKIQNLPRFLHASRAILSQLLASPTTLRAVMLIPPDRAPSASGVLTKTPMVHLFVYADERRLTGTLVFREPNGAEHALVLHEGAPTKVLLHRDDLVLSHTLTDLGILSPDDAAHHFAHAEAAGILLGNWLVEQNLVEQAQLEDALDEHTERKYAQLALIDERSEYAFYTDVDLLGPYAAGRQQFADPFSLVWAGVRQRPPWEHINATLSRVGALGFRMTPHTEVERFRFAKNELALLDKLAAEGPLRMAELVATRLLGSNAVQLVVYTLLITKQIEVVEVTHAPASLRPAASAGRSSAPGARVAPLAPTSAPSVNGTPHAPLAAPVSKPAGTLIAATKSSPNAVSVSKVGAALSETGATAALQSDVEIFRNEIVERAKTITGLDYFQMLGLGRDATPEEVNQIYFQLARKWHPDKLPASLSAVKAEATKVFSHISEAQRTLGDRKKREEYMHLLKDGGATLDDQQKIQIVLEAVTYFQKAEFFWKRRDVAQAEEFAHKAANADPGQADYLALAAWIESSKPENQNPDATRKCIEKLDKALGHNRNCAQALFYRAMLHKRIGQQTEAIRDFRLCVEINPDNVDAAREVRLHAMRGGRSVPPPSLSDDKGPTVPRPPSTGFLGKLFKK